MNEPDGFYLGFVNEDGREATRPGGSGGRKACVWVGDSIQPDRRMATAAESRSWFGHPAGLSTLFFTEMWERLSFYGMRALLILYMTEATLEGGLGYSVANAATVYGWYTAFVYIMALPGGFIADRWLGYYRSIFVGGVIISVGHFCMAFSLGSNLSLGDKVIHDPMFFLAMALIVTGTGLLKPNITSMVGALYEPGDPRRDGGFSLYYMGINIGAAAAPFVCGTLAQTQWFKDLLASWGMDPTRSWHWGFGAAGVGMVVGLIQFWYGRHRLEPAMRRIAESERQHREAPVVKGGEFLGLRKNHWMGIVLVEVLIFVVLTGILPELAGLLAANWWVIATMIGLTAAGSYLARLGLNPTELKRIGVIAVLFLFSALFWSGFEQAGSSLNLFADQKTRLSFLGISLKSTWFQALNPIYIILFAPAFSWLWVALRHREPSSPLKFAIALMLLAGGFLLIVPAAQMAEGGTKVSPLWLGGVFLLHTLGELCLSPVSLSMVTKLSPPRLVGTMMGFWMLSYAAGNKIGGWIASYFDAGKNVALPDLFLRVCVISALAGVLLLAFIKPLKRMMGGVK